MDGACTHPLECRNFAGNRAVFMSFADRVRRVSPATWAAAFAVLLVFPWLGSFGFWDPWELSIAERAREMVKAGRIGDVTVNGRYGAEPPLELISAALGMKLF